jgi:hypothetical protein
MDSNQHHPPHDHERTDVEVPVLAWMAIALALFLFISVPLMIGLFKLFQWEDKPGEALSPLAVTEQPPAPNLQAVPSLELGEYRRRQKKLLDEYGWIDKQQRIVRIPIGEATRLLAERGLPKVPPQPATAPNNGPADTPKADAPGPEAAP